MNKAETLRVKNRNAREKRAKLRAENKTLESTNKKLLKNKKKLDAEVKEITKDNKNLSKMFKILLAKINATKDMSGPELVAELSVPFWDKNSKLLVREINQIRHAALDYMMNDEQVLSRITGLSKDEFDSAYKKFLKRLAKDPKTRQIRGTSITQGNTCKLLPNHILLLQMVRKHCTSQQMLLEKFFKIDQSSISRYLSTTQEHFKGN